MSDKFEFYDLLGILVPGSILLALIALSFPQITSVFASVAFPDAFAVICLTAAAVLTGHLVQAVSSLLEPLLDWTWGGRASERALRGELPSRYFPNDTAERIRAKLMRAVGSGATERSLFLYAMQIAETSTNSRVSKFNGLYAYHRALVTLLFLGLALLLVAIFWGPAEAWPIRNKIMALMIVLLLLLIVWQRAKQRAYYYVREVLTTAERLVDLKSG
jgi:hypothetical protein